MSSGSEGLVVSEAFFKKFSNPKLGSKYLHSLWNDMRLVTMSMYDTNIRRCEEQFRGSQCQSAELKTRLEALNSLEAACKAITRKLQHCVDSFLPRADLGDSSKVDDIEDHFKQILERLKEVLNACEDSSLDLDFYTRHKFVNVKELYNRLQDLYEHRVNPLQDVRRSLAAYISCIDLVLDRDAHPHPEHEILPLDEQEKTIIGKFKELCQRALECDPNDLDKLIGICKRIRGYERTHCSSLTHFVGMKEIFDNDLEGLIRMQLLTKDTAHSSPNL